MRSVSCRRCQRVLGTTDGLRFVVAGLTFEKTVTFRCDCSQRRVWTPVKIIQLAGV